jgi:DNA invertase Pin-like site-specific DNA recombinase
MTVAVYARVSTVEQNLAGQKREINQWLQGNGVNPKSVHWYVDKVSGATLERPELDQLQKDIFSGAIKTVVVYRLDRLSRNMQHGVDLLCDWCDKGVRIVSTSESIDFSGITGKMVAAILFAVAQMERGNIKERQAVGIAAAKERGVYTGRKPGALKPGVDPKRAVKLKSKGLTNEEIAKALGVSVRSVIRYIQQSAA